MIKLLTNRFLYRIGVILMRYHTCEKKVDKKAEQKIREVYIPKGGETTCDVKPSKTKLCDRIESEKRVACSSQKPAAAQQNKLPAPQKGASPSKAATPSKSAGGTSSGKKGGSPKKEADPHRVFKIYRFGGIKSKENPHLQSYELDISNCGKMVLDALIKIKDMDPTVTFRRSCREGICGSCAINLQGKNCLACITEIPPDKTITIHPLPHMYVIRDLVVDMTHFFNGYDSIRPYLIRKSEPGTLGQFQYAQSIKDNAKMIGLYECVLCSCCATACPSYWWNGRRFLGPATLLHAYRWVIDSRDEDTEQRLFDLRDDFKAFRCHTIMNCALTCPKGLNPGLAIGRLKRLISRLDKKPYSEIDPLRFRSPPGGGNKC